MHRFASALIVAPLVLGCGDDDDDDDDVPVATMHQLTATIEENPGFDELSGYSVVTWTEGLEDGCRCRHPAREQQCLVAALQGVEQCLGLVE